MSGVVSTIQCKMWNTRMKIALEISLQVIEEQFPNMVFFRFEELNWSLKKFGNFHKIILFFL